MTNKTLEQYTFGYCKGCKQTKALKDGYCNECDSKENFNGLFKDIFGDTDNIFGSKE